MTLWGELWFSEQGLYAQSGRPLNPDFSPVLDEMSRTGEFDGIPKKSQARDEAAVEEREGESPYGLSSSGRPRPLLSEAPIYNGPTTGRSEGNRTGCWTLPPLRGYADRCRIRQVRRYAFRYSLRSGYRARQ